MATLVSVFIIIVFAVIGIGLRRYRVAQFIETNNKIINLLSAVFVAIFTVVLAVSTILLWIAGERQRSLSEDTAQRQLRAYMVADMSSVTRWKQGQTAEAETIMKNTGLTPAYDIEGWSAIMYDKYPLPYKFPISVPLETTLAQSVLGSGGVVRLKAPTKTVVPTLETNTEFEAGTMALYFWGKVTYRDAFGKERFTNFRFYMTRPTESGELFQPLSKEGNEAN
jgi:hypothetical protein